MYKGFLAHMALDSRVIVFNVDYRLAPETRLKRMYIVYSTLPTGEVGQKYYALKKSSPFVNSR